MDWIWMHLDIVINFPIWFYLVGLTIWPKFAFFYRTEFEPENETESWTNYDYYSVSSKTVKINTFNVSSNGKSVFILLLFQKHDFYFYVFLLFFVKYQI